MDKVTPKEKREKKPLAGFASRHKTVLIIGGVLLAGGLYVFTSTPLSGIIGGEALGAAFGLPQQSLGYITPLDLSIYASGAQNSKVYGVLSDIEEQNDYDRGNYVFGSITPFVSQEDRLINAKREFSRGIEATKSALSQIQGSLSLADTFEGPARIEGVALASENAGSANAGVFDKGRLAGEIMEGKPVPPLGAFKDSSSDFTRVDAADLETRPSGQVGANIQGKAEPESSFSKVLDASSVKFTGGRTGALGGYNAMVGRIKTDRLSIGQLNAFTDLGHVFFFSSSALKSRYTTSAKKLSAAAFDGGAQEEEMLIIPDEKEEIYIGGDTRSPSTILMQIQESTQRCREAKAQHQQAADSAATEINVQMKGIQKIIEENEGRVPGSCERVLGIEFAGTATAREKWNLAIENISQQCAIMDRERGAYFEGCDFNYEAETIEYPYSCSYIANMKLEGGCSFGICQFSCASTPKWFDISKFNCDDTSDCKAKMEEKLKEVAHFMVTLR